VNGTHQIPLTQMIRSYIIVILSSFNPINYRIPQTRLFKKSKKGWKELKIKEKYYRPMRFYNIDRYLIIWYTMTTISAKISEN
jgi:hypothetical protein